MQYVRCMYRFTYYSATFFKRKFLNNSLEKQEKLPLMNMIWMIPMMKIASNSQKPLKNLKKLWIFTSAASFQIFIYTLNLLKEILSNIKSYKDFKIKMN